ncbi:MAG: class I SAM-dependent methyltransferase [Flavitalea sp.]
MSTQGFYNRFAAFYPFVDFFLSMHKGILNEELNALPAGRLLEVGVGNGSNLKWMQKHQLTGIDTSFGMLIRARKKVDRMEAGYLRAHPKMSIDKDAAIQKYVNVHLAEMSGEQMTFQDESFDYIVLSHVLAVTRNPDRMLGECYRVLKPGGQLLILNHFTPRNWFGFVDKLVKPVGKALHFRSVFNIESIPNTRKFRLVKERAASGPGYFKLMIYTKD